MTALLKRVRPGVWITLGILIALLVSSLAIGLNGNTPQSTPQSENTAKTPVNNQTTSPAIAPAPSYPPTSHPGTRTSVPTVNKINTTTTGPPQNNGTNNSPQVATIPPLSHIDTSTQTSVSTAFLALVNGYNYQTPMATWKATIDRLATASVVAQLTAMWTPPEVNTLESNQTEQAAENLVVTPNPPSNTTPYTVPPGSTYVTASFVLYTINKTGAINTMVPTVAQIGVSHYAGGWVVTYWGQEPS